MKESYEKGLATPWPYACLDSEIATRNRGSLEDRVTEFACQLFFAPNTYTTRGQD